MSNDREVILGRVRQALAPLPKRAEAPDWERELVVMRNARGAVDAAALFTERLKLVNGTPISSLADLVALFVASGWRRGYCDPALVARLRPAFPAEIVFETDFDRTRVDDYQFGITAAVGAIAETGTVILNDAATSRRLAALAPWVHVAVVPRSRIHIDLPEAVAALGSDPNIIWCTGPSKTADVEGILIEGVHGPGVQIALLVD
jgi:L-lactate dehydrogenase complex protein LldG